MEILLTGANGFLGKSVLNELTKDVNNKNNVFSLGKSSGDFRVSLEKQIPNFKKKFELVIHAAGKAHCLPKTDNEKKEFYEINVLGTQNLLKGLEESGMPNEFVFISSVSVYGHDTGENINESHHLHATDPYGLSKIEAEKLITHWCHKNNIVCSILRLPLLVGQNPPGNLGAMVKAIQYGYYFNVGGGKAKKSMVLAIDVASFILRVAPVGGVYNLTDGFHPSFNELSLAICKNKNKRRPINFPIWFAKYIGIIGDYCGIKLINSSKIKKIIYDLTFDDSKARDLLNWKPKPVLDYLKDNNI